MSPHAASELSLRGYCIRRRGESPPPAQATGVGGETIRSLETDSLGIWLSADDGGNPTIERLREHDRVVREAMRSATPLPLRFGTHFRDEAAVLRALAEREIEFLEALERVRDHVEMGIRVHDAASGQQTAARSRDEGAPDLPAGRPGFATESPGRAYLTRRREAAESVAIARRRAVELLQEVEAVLSDLATDSVREPASDGAFVGTLAHLVQKGRIQHYMERVERLQEQRRDLRLAVSGPWAPYSFVR